jgi:DNA-binding NarL/FixJ family response regulator
VVGVFNISILINQPSIQNFAIGMSEVLSTGLLGSTIEAPTFQTDAVYFTKRENEILHYLLKGYTAKNIARALFISKRTVEHHIENMKHKSCCDSTIELINKHYHKVIGDSQGKS